MSAVLNDKVLSKNTCIPTDPDYYSFHFISNRALPCSDCGIRAIPESSSPVGYIVNLHRLLILFKIMFTFYNYNAIFFCKNINPSLFFRFKTVNNWLYIPPLAHPRASSIVSLIHFLWSVGL